MLHRPWSIIILAFTLGLLGPVLALHWLRENSFDFINAAINVNPYLTAISVVAFVVSFGVWRVQFWGYLGYLLLACSALAYLLIDFLMVGDLENYLPLTLAATFAIGTVLLLQRHVSAPYFNPRLRWWERDPRYRVHLGVKFQIDRLARNGQLLDLSRSGCFAELDAKLVVGEEIEIRVQLLTFDFTARAQVIWHNSDPKGYGLMFMGMTRRHRKEIDKILSYLVDAQGERGPLINTGISSAS